LRGFSLGERELYAPALGFCILVVELLTELTKTSLQLPSFDWKKTFTTLAFPLPFFIDTPFV
jgi:hypothetical protein